MNKENIVLIGMPGAGKSTVGVILAKTLKKPFIDTDLLIQQKYNLRLQELIHQHGIEGFLKMEEEVICHLEAEDHVIATGGSVIYSPSAMEHLHKNGILVYLHLKYYKIVKRIKNITTRGIAMREGQDLSSLYRERVPLYRKYCDIFIDCSHMHMETVISEIIEKVEKFLSKGV